MLIDLLLDAEYNLANAYAYNNYLLDERRTNPSKLDSIEKENDQLRFELQESQNERHSSYVKNLAKYRYRKLKSKKRTLGEDIIPFGQVQKRRVSD